MVNLPLSWRGVEQSPRPSYEVSQALAASTIAFALRDVRPDPATVGGYEDSSLAVRTSDNVAAYCSKRIGEILARAGARFASSPQVVVETELLEYRVIEGNDFNGTVRIRTMIHSGEQTWTQTYNGVAKRWGRTHNPENFNEALSNALADAAQQLLNDAEFAAAITAAAPAGPTFPSDSYPLPNQGLAPGVSANEPR